MKRIGSLVALVALSACSHKNCVREPGAIAWDETSAAQLKVASETMLKAWESGDPSQVAAGIADDGYLVSYDLDMAGQPISFNSKSEVVAHAEKMGAAMKAMGVSVKSKLTRVDCQATASFGVCINEMECEMTVGGKTEQMWFRGTGTARKGEDGWKWTHWHGSLAKLPPQPAAAAPAPATALPTEAVAVKKKELKWETVPGPSGIKVASTWSDAASGAGTSYVEMPRNTKMPRHYHSSDSWVHIVKGSMKVSFVDGKVVELSEGDFGFMPAKVQHVTEAKNGVTLFQYTDGADDIVMVDDQGNPLPVPAAAAPQ